MIATARCCLPTTYRQLGKSLKPGEGVVCVICVTASVCKWSAIAERDRNRVNAEAAGVTAGVSEAFPRPNARLYVAAPTAGFCQCAPRERCAAGHRM